MPGQKKEVESDRARAISSGGCASAWLCKKYFEPWRRAAWADGGPRSHRAKLIAALPIIGAFFAGMLATAFILVALG